MKAKKHVITFTIFLCMAVAGMVMHAPCFAAALVPEDVTVRDGFQPGAGPVIGNITEIDGQAVVIHDNDKNGYSVRKAMSLYKNDHLITLPKGRMVFMLNDGSVMNLLPETRLQINQSVYAPSRKTRSGLINLVEGKVRFWITKMANYSDSSFQVKTRTAVMGIRGSDFIVKATAKMSEVITLEDTLLELRSLTHLDGDPIIMKDFQRSIIPEIGYPEMPMDIVPQEAQTVRQEFAFGGDPSKIEPAGEESSGTGESGELKGLPPAPEQTEGQGDPGDVSNMNSILNGAVIDTIEAQKLQQGEPQVDPPDYTPGGGAPPPPPEIQELPDMPGTPE